MKTKEVSPNDWKKICEQITAASRGALITIRQASADSDTTRMIAEQLPLQSIALDEKSDACNNLLVIEAGTEKPLRHEIVEPIHLLLKNGQNERFNQLEIHSESGRTTVTFSPGINSVLLQPPAK